MANIRLSGGQSVQIDDEDAALLTSRRWYAVRRGSRLYAESASHPQILMHRLILGEACKGSVVDHINGDGLDNRRVNLRVCTQRENARNRLAVRGLRGVSWRPAYGTWRARIMVDRKEIHLGSFETEREAAHAYNAAASEHFGKFAKLNIFGPAPAAESSEKAA